MPQISCSITKGRVRSSILLQELAELVVKPLDIVLAVSGTWFHSLTIRTHYLTRGRLQDLPPAQCPQIEGNTLISPTPGRMFSTSISESSGAVAIVRVSITDQSKVLSPRPPGILAQLFSTLSHTNGARNKKKNKKNSRKYKSVLAGKTNVFALMPFMAALKSPL
jgi:hypothetical protein